MQTITSHVPQIALKKLSISCFWFLVLPYIHPFDFDERVNYGDSVQLTCHVAKGDLPITIKWLFNDKPLFTHLNIQTTKLGDRSSFLTIPSVTADNTGNYTCAASNEAGHFDFSAKLNVLGTRNPNVDNNSEFTFVRNSPSLVMTFAVFHLVHSFYLVIV